ncbi:MAG TPA: HEAT repeat domain-containing protein [Blastocatellia bacterium]|nr:HEAT repeat domain-containing protein [Blastocatellia bacterium]
MSNSDKNENPCIRDLLFAARVFALACVAIIATAWLHTSAATRSSEQEIERLNRLVQASNSSDEAAQVFREARDYIKDREWAKAEQKFRSLVREHPQHKDADAALYYLAYALHKQNRLQESDRILEQLITEHPKSSWVNDARAMRIEMAPRLKNNDTIAQGIKEEDEELKLAALQSLFESSPERALRVALDILKPGSRSSATLKEGAIELLADSESAEARAAVLEVARSETDPRLRRRAVEMLGQVGGADVIELLKGLAIKSSDKELAHAAMRALAEHSGPQSRTVLIEIARNSTDIDLRTTAISELSGEGDDSLVDEFVKLFDAEKNEDVRRRIISALSDIGTPRALAKIVEIAKSSTDVEIRRAAISALGDREDGQAVETLIQMYDAERDQDMKEEIISALGDMENKRALRKLMEIIKSDAPSHLKRRALERLGESEDPEAAKFLEELLRKNN